MGTSHFNFTDLYHLFSSSWFGILLPKSLLVEECGKEMFGPTDIKKTLELITQILVFYFDKSLKEHPEEFILPPSSKYKLELKSST